ncbi:glycosyltransferase [Dactylosporangium sp. McL0621]|uniref:glycosyltransferase n=1 Tax=Dactylosporangium sp. McL0621 TaxID=3415678 RepID=UPI003CE89BCF
MRILFTANPMYGHVNPMLPLVHAARAAGHDVVVATGADLVPHLAGHGVTTWTAGPSHREAGGGPDADWLAYFVSSAQRRAAELVPLAADWKPDLVVSEDTELAGPVAAAVTGARHVVHGIGLMPPIQLWPVLGPAIRKMLHRYGAEADHRAATYLELCPPSLRPPGERIWPRTLDLRPVAGLPAAGQRLPAALDALPYEDTVHVTLGTVFHDHRDVLRTVVAALAALPVNVVATVGPGTDPARFGPVPGNVLLAPYLPHALLLPRCTAVVSQGGAGILFGALAHALPQLVLPQGGDQFGNAAALAASGAGLALDSAAAVADGVNELLRASSFRARAAVVQRELTLMPHAPTVLARLTA